jgi:AraC family transcriptional regulator of adaptative response/methylated-DNA-[protein]-cysteine methyltransferase
MDTGTPVRFHGCKSTHIFCLPTCRYDRRVLAKNHVTFDSEESARAAGYRPCKVCRPVENAPSGR